jgi:cytochrome c oxidase assembly protein subunit 15
LFLYPWTTWFFGPWDIFVEHGHRLLGGLAGFISIALVWSLWKTKAPRGTTILGLAVFAAIASQGVIGGLRVTMNEPLLAMVHACTGPPAFAVCAAAWYFTSQRAAVETLSGDADAKVFRLAMLTTCFAYLQLVIGAVIRHMPVYAPPQTFHAAVMFHLTVATVLFVEIVVLAGTASRTPAFRGRSRFLLSLLLVQLGLGAGTWIVKYGFPQWVSAVAATPDYVVRPGSWPQILTTAGHVAVGSLILVTALLLALRSWPAAKAATTATSSFAGLALREALR